MTIAPGFYPIEYFVPADAIDAAGDDIDIKEHAFADGYDAGKGFRENAANELAEWHADTLKQAIKDGQLNAWLDGFATSARAR